MNAKPVQPILVAHLFAPVRAELLRILRGLSEEQWQQPTACAGWTVKDVALHILGDDLGVLSYKRDKFSERADFDGWDGLVRWVNQRNAAWVQATRRLSTRLLCELLEFSGASFTGYIASLDLYAPGPPVSWAGKGPAPVWLDVAREYTEQWLHHQHICDAVGSTSLKERKFFFPVLDTFARALPHAYREVAARPGTVVELAITGDVGGTWYVARKGQGWNLYTQVDASPACTVTLPPEVAWRLFTKGIAVEAARRQTTLAGDLQLAEPIFHMVSILA